MLAVDSSTIIAYLGGETGADVTLFAEKLAREEIALPPVVIAELLSACNITETLSLLLEGMNMLPVLPGFWERTGARRRKLRMKNLKARLPDALIAQSCIDHDMPLITRDEDFRHYAKHGGLKLAVK